MLEQIQPMPIIGYAWLVMSVVAVLFAVFLFIKAALYMRREDPAAPAHGDRVRQKCKHGECGTCGVTVHPWCFEPAPQKRPGSKFVGGLPDVDSPAKWEMTRCGDTLIFTHPAHEPVYLELGPGGEGGF